MESAKLVEVIKKLEASGIALESAAEKIAIPAQLIKLYSIGDLVPGRIVKKLEGLLPAA
ncbi:MAG: hypothetical protein HY788_16115 [Deltaproteobacteria bacterium]|nr:hypothetical protein [Deltaproteobacteria bacterium]